MLIQQKLPPPALLFSDFAGLDSAGGGSACDCINIFLFEKEEAENMAYISFGSI